MIKSIVELHNGFTIAIECDVETDIKYNSDLGYNIILESPEGDNLFVCVHPREMEVIKNMFGSIETDKVSEPIS